MKSGIFFFGLLFSIAYAGTAGAKEGHGAGNGGNAYVCFKTAATKAAVEATMRANRAHPETPDYPLPSAFLAEIDGNVRLLDLVEHDLESMDRKASPLIRTDAPYLDVLRDRLRTLALRNAIGLELEDLFRLTLPPEKFRFSSAGVVTVDDSEHAILADPRCLIIQVAVQKTVGLETTVTIDRNLFARMASVDRAALISHELFVLLENRNLAASGGTESPSPAARKLNGLLYERRLATRDGLALAYEIETLDPFFTPSVFRCTMPREGGEKTTTSLMTTVSRNPRTLETSTTHIVLRDAVLEVGSEFGFRIPESASILRLRRSPQAYFFAEGAPIVFAFHDAELPLRSFTYDEANDEITVNASSARTLLGFSIAESDGGHGSADFARDASSGKFYLRSFRAARAFSKDGFTVRSGQEVELDSNRRISRVRDSAPVVITPFSE